jgi:hypothetical protein
MAAYRLRLRAALARQGNLDRGMKSRDNGKIGSQIFICKSGRLKWK